MICFLNKIRLVFGFSLPNGDSLGFHHIGQEILSFLAYVDQLRFHMHGILLGVLDQTESLSGSFGPLH